MIATGRDEMKTRLLIAIRVDKILRRKERFVTLNIRALDVIVVDRILGNRGE